jgi:hypothetical protein
MGVPSKSVTFPEIVTESFCAWATIAIKQSTGIKSSLFITVEI